MLPDRFDVYQGVCVLRVGTNEYPSPSGKGESPSYG